MQHIWIIDSFDKLEYINKLVYILNFYYFYMQTQDMSYNNKTTVLRWYFDSISMSNQNDF